MVNRPDWYQAASRCEYVYGTKMEKLLREFSEHSIMCQRRGWGCYIWSWIHSSVPEWLCIWPITIIRDAHTARVCPSTHLHRFGRKTMTCTHADLFNYVSYEPLKDRKDETQKHKSICAFILELVFTFIMFVFILLSKLHVQTPSIVHNRCRLGILFSSPCFECVSHCINITLMLGMATAE